MQFAFVGYLITNYTETTMLLINSRLLDGNFGIERLNNEVEELMSLTFRLFLLQQSIMWPIHLLNRKRVI
jgi:hypothetical protein